MIAYKVLYPGRRALFTGFVWPAPDADDPWVRGPERPRLCEAGVHACRAESLPIWLGPELWEIELDGELLSTGRKLVASRGRLLRRVEEWDEEAKLAFADACADEARRRAQAAPELAGYAEDVAALRADAPLVGFVGARLAELHEGAGAYDAERARQARWLADRLGLRVETPA